MSKRRVCGLIAGTRRSGSSTDLSITVSGDFAFAHCYLHMTGTKKGPEGSVNFWMRETICFGRIRGSWRIVHEHTSVPFYMDGTLRPVFDLQPRTGQRSLKQDRQGGKSRDQGKQIDRKR